MERKRGFVFLAAMALTTISVLIPIGEGAGGASSNHNYKIGLILPLSGVFAPLTGPQVNGAKLAIQASGGGSSLYTCDDQGTPATGVSCFTKLHEQDSIKLLAGPLVNGTVQAVTPLASNAQIPEYELAPSFPVSSAKKFKAVIVADPSVDAMSLKMAQFASHLGDHNIYVVTTADDTGAASITSMQAAVQHVPGMHFVGSSTINPATPNANVAMSAAATAHATFIWAPVSGPQFVAVIDGASAEGVNAPIGTVIINCDYLTAGLLKGHATSTMSVYSNCLAAPLASSLPKTVPGYKQATTIAKQYTAKFGTPITTLGASGYDAIAQLIQAANLGGGSTPNDVMNGFAQMKTVNGAEGVYHYGPDVRNGIGAAGLFIGKYTSGAWQYVPTSGSSS